MPLQVKCPNSACGSVAAIDDKLVGANTRCTACGTAFHVTAPDRVARFQREARFAAQLRHANIVPVFDIGQDGGQYYIASAYIPGQTLHDALDDKPMPFQRAARIVRDLADAVGSAHQQGVVHRDLKPANIPLDEKNSPRLVDFGLSARQETEPREKTNHLTRLGAVLGTPAYMAPEQASGQTGEAQPAADQYSLGIILYELLCGQPPFEGPPALVIYNVLRAFGKKESY